jgi:hypothetical protein
LCVIARFIHILLETLSMFIFQILLGTNMVLGLFSSKLAGCGIIYPKQSSVHSHFLRSKSFYEDISSIPKHECP